MDAHPNKSTVRERETELHAIWLRALGDAAIFAGGRFSSDFQN